MSVASDEDHLALGRAVDAWSEAEGWIFYMFSIISRTTLDVAYAIMASFGGFGPQRDLFERIVKLQPMEDDLRKILLEASKEFERLTPQRNKIIHGEWQAIGTPEKLTTYRVGKTKNLRYLDAYLKAGEDPQRAIFTVEMLDTFTADCAALSKRMYEMCDHPHLRRDFSTVS